MSAPSQTSSSSTSTASASTFHLSAVQQNGSAPPSPAMSQSQQPQNYQYPIPNSQQQGDPYRAGTAGMNGSSAISGGPYYQAQGAVMGQPYPSVTSDVNGANARFALPPVDNRVMSGGRHKKEIKRRTKTGCMTCRKRRIKCDELHPTCGNCRKSKRECAGYDPVYGKPNHSGTANIQPAPAGSPQTPNPSPYGQAPLMAGGYGPSAAYDSAAVSAAASSPGSSNAAFEYSAIDPALEAAAAPAGQSSTTTNANMPRQPQTPQPQAQAGSTPYKVPVRMARIQCTMEEMFDWGGHTPHIDVAEASQGLDNARLDEIKHLFLTIYSPGLEAFFESKWWSQQGLDHLLRDATMLQKISYLATKFNKVPSGMAEEELLQTQNIESRCAWDLACMPNQHAGQDATNLENPPIGQARETAARVAVFEALITGGHLKQNPLTPAPSFGEHHRLRELDFWHQVGEYVTITDANGEDSMNERIDANIARMRFLLDGRENRDVIYSIVVCRGFGVRNYDWTAPPPAHFDEKDPRHRVAVAKRFIYSEAQGNGTTNVCRRFCELVIRYWTKAVYIDAAEIPHQDRRNEAAGQIPTTQAAGQGMNYQQ